MGVVIGETAIIGDLALIYQGGDLRWHWQGNRQASPNARNRCGHWRGCQSTRQHSNRVTTFELAAGSVVLREVPSDCTVVGIPGRIVYRSGERVEPLDHAKLPDSEAMAIRALVDRIDALENELNKIRENQAQRCEIASGQKKMRRPDADRARLLEVGAGRDDQIAMLMRALQDESCEPDQCCRIEDRAIQEFLGGAGI